MDQFASQPRAAASPLSDLVPSPSQTVGSAEPGNPVFTRVRTSHFKTATVTVTLEETALTSALAITSSELPMMATMMNTLLPSLTTSTLSSVEQNTPLPKSTNSPGQEDHVTLPVNKLITITVSVVGGLVVAILLMCIIRAFVRRRHAIKEDAKAAAGTQEQGASAHDHFHENGSSAGISQPASRAFSETDMYQHFHASNNVANVSFRTLPAAYAAYELHPTRIIAELPAEPHGGGGGHSRHDYRG
ncbi:hypothetical protein CORC01_00129 [Colletotrichum orchidophilum]|uniref:Uncharacterized protein n=1 Tax=Colletotrichum orchidophilum TaxID=1209926 RepID=A0A1G4BTF3_9PEZI|nr:uncharacterized protein CORC01_00129 [Colletotrichum orchidophilum]OHF04658.1 hypothetical protein CORC01_00129 [Colletotrichum orchidophilum]